MTRVQLKVLSLICGMAGLILLIAEAIRGTNAGIYADKHGTAGRFDLIDGILIIGGLLLLVITLGVFDLKGKDRK